jgi:SAM-dependent methyltransferase
MAESRLSPMTAKLDQRFFRRLNEADDELFYSAPRMVVHIDDGAIREVGNIFLAHLPNNGAILDLMSSWRSHLPLPLSPSRVVGLGLNRQEMDANPALSEAVVHNLNREPHLPFADAAFDGAVLTVSVQYLLHPVEVFADVGRVLRPGGPFVVSFSNRMFPTKAVAMWLEASEQQRVELVRKYFVDSGAFEKIEVIDRSRCARSDPIWAVVGYRIYSAR